MDRLGVRPPAVVAALVVLLPLLLATGSLVPDDDTVRRTLMDKATARVLEEARSFPIDLVQTQGPAPTPEQFHKIVDAINSVMLPSMTVDDQQQKLLVEIGPARP